MIAELGPRDDFFEVNPRNGAGYIRYQPSEQGSITPQTHTDILHSLTFPNSPYYLTVADAQPTAALAIEGCPGVGKSHLARDLVIASIGVARAAFNLQLHIAAGKSTAMAGGAQRMEAFLTDQSTTPLLIVDNIDYLGYRGRSRTGSNVETALDTYGEALIRLISSDSVTVVGTMHSGDWRNNHWVNIPEELKERAGVVVDALGSPIEFEGKMDFESAMKHLYRRHVNEDLARKLVFALQRTTGSLLFRHVHHLPSEITEIGASGDLMRRQSDVEAVVVEAIQSIDARTQQKVLE